MTARTTTAVFAALCAGVAIAPAAAQQQDFSEVVIEATDLGDGLYMLTGSGGNMGLSVGEDGTFLIDDQYAPLTERIEAAIAELTDEPVGFVINTHWHFDHVGGNENFGTRGATIVAHENVRTRMAEGATNPVLDITIEPAPPAALPIVTYENGMTLHLNGERADIIAMPPAHTDGDSIVHWPERNVVHTGDIFVNGFYPFIDAWSGGGIDGVVENTAALLEMTDADTKIIPGHGPLGTRADLHAFHDMIVTVRDRAYEAKAAGKDAESWAAENPLADLDETWGDGFLTGEQFAQIAFAGLK